MINYLDQLLDSRIKFGKSHVTSIIAMFLVNLSCGSHDAIIKFVFNKILKNQLKFTYLETEIACSVPYLGIFLGILLCNKLSAYFDRKHIIIFSLLCQTMLLYLQLFIQIHAFHIIARLLTGTLFALCVPYTFVIVAELVPQANKPQCYIFVYGAIIIGQIYSCILAILFLDSVSSGNWKLIVIFVSFPYIIAMLTIPKYLIESPKLLMQKNRIEEVINWLNYMGNNNNNNFSQITQQEKDFLEAQIKQQDNSNSQNNVAQYKDLFSEKNRSMTLKLWVLGINKLLLRTGVLFLMPFLLASIGRGQNISDMFFIIMPGQGSALVVAYLLMRSPLITRRQVLMLTFIGIIITNFLIFFFKEKILVLGLGIINFCYILLDINIKSFATESYEFKMKTMGLNMIDGIGCFIGLMTPILTMSIFKLNHYLPFLVFSLFSQLALIMTYLLQDYDKKQNLEVVKVVDNHFDRSKSL